MGGDVPLDEDIAAMIKESQKSEEKKEKKECGCKEKAH
jgi:hypothetical protein